MTAMQEFIDFMRLAVKAYTRFIREDYEERGFPSRRLTEEERLEDFGSFLEYRYQD